MTHLLVVLLVIVLLLLVPTELTDNTEAYGVKLLEYTEWPTLREARILRNDCLYSCPPSILQPASQSVC